jgi:glucosamine-6-phosphate deaminase
MKILIFDDRAQAVARVVDLISQQLRDKPVSVLGLATGGTMEPVYTGLVAAYAAGHVSFAQATSFNLDEYVGLSGDHPNSYASFMRNKLFSQVDMPADRSYLLNGVAADPKQEADRYEARIDAAGGIDLQLLGIGEDCHIGFNEPTSSLNSLTRIKTLTARTIAANSRYFERPEDMPRCAITMGVGTILRSRKVVLLAMGKGKCAAVAAMVEGPVSARCPASALQLHRDVTVVLDREAASELELTEYYETVHPNGREPDVL